jgi:ATP-dependent DNA helicase RecG
MLLTLDHSVLSLPGVGAARAEQLEALGITTIRDLLYDAPFRYETIEREVKIKDLLDGHTVCIHAEVVSKFPIRTAIQKYEGKVRDETGSLDINWFNNSFVLSSYR